MPIEGRHLAGRFAKPEGNLNLGESNPGRCDSVG